MNILHSLKKALITGIITSLLCISQSSLAAIAVITNKDNPLDSIDKLTLQRMYLGKIKALPNGQLIMPIHQAEDSTIREAFRKKVLEKTNSQLYSYWSRMLFTGRAKPPRAINTGVTDTINFVQRQENSLAYIPAEQVDASVKVLLIIK